MSRIEEKWKFNRYCKLYSRYFNVERPRYEGINYDDLISKISNVFEQKIGRSVILKKNEEIKLKDKIRCEIKIDGDSYIGVLITLFIYMTMKAFDFKNFELFQNLFIMVIGLNFVYFLVYKLYLTSRHTVNKSFYQLCLDILENVEVDSRE
ncbi:hypothetical protein [Wukongibacter sp. M2B1]|uniref:hypothetical protein n=1 Tax=Wukongibacter sp. M2B1 TaxID=3088895 RepID=UPI003D7C1089